MVALRTARAALPALVLLAGCSHEHAPTTDRPDTTSLGVAGNRGEGDVSTAYGLAAERPGLPGVDNDRADRSTSTAVRPAPLIPGAPGNPDTPRTSNAVQSWTSGPTLPVERANMALEPEAPGKPPAHGASGHPG